MDKFYVLMENGEPVVVARENKESMVNEWKNEAPGRETRLVPEAT